MIDEAFAVSIGIIVSVLCAMFYAINLFRYKLQSKNFDRVFWFVVATVIIFFSILCSNLAYVGGRFPRLDYHGWLSESAYMPYTKIGVMTAIIVYIRAMTGDKFPHIWLWCACLSTISTFLAYSFIQ